MLKWIREKLGITLLALEIDILKNRLKNQEARHLKEIASLKAYTRVDADVGFRGNNTIILTGVYRNQGFVKFYDVGNGEFIELVKRLKVMERHAIIRNIDSPPNFHGVFEL